jgi:hypothetical protein
MNQYDLISVLLSYFQRLITRSGNALLLAVCWSLSVSAWALPVVDIHNRQAVQRLYNSVYLSSNGIAAQWNGNVGACNAGDTSAAYKNAVLQRINYFRSMSGVAANINFDAELNRKAREAALMMSANRLLSHQPLFSWTCYSAIGAEAAGESNLGLSTHGYQAISLMMEDPGAENISVGHRRWVYYPQTKIMGTGDIVPSPINDFPAAHASVIQDDNLFAARPITRDGFVSWPPPGFVPYQLVFPRWSFSYANADFSNAIVSMTNTQGEPIAVNIIYRSEPPEPGFMTAPEKTISWEPVLNLEITSTGNDVAYHVIVENVMMNGKPQRFQYRVTAIDPSVAGLPPQSGVQPFMLTGSVTVNHRWRSLDLPQNISQPIVITGAPTANGLQPGAMQIQNQFNGSAIRVRFREWDYLDNIHTSESVDYLMIEEGVYLLPDGTLIQAGRFPISGMHNWKTVQFSNRFRKAPHVFVSLQTASDQDVAAIRLHNINPQSFDASLFEQESLISSGHGQEVAGYVAIEHPQNSGVLNFNGSLAASEYSLAHIQLDHRWSDIFGHQIKLEEEQSLDAETIHALESVDVLSLGDKLFTQIVSDIGLNPALIRRQ